MTGVIRQEVQHLTTALGMLPIAPAHLRRCSRASVQPSQVFMLCCQCAVVWLTIVLLVMQMIDFRPLLQYSLLRLLSLGRHHDCLRSYHVASARQGIGRLACLSGL